MKQRAEREAILGLLPFVVQKLAENAKNKDSTLREIITSKHVLCESETFYFEDYPSEDPNAPKPDWSQVHVL
jgi:DNA-directed RNA polymerase specialized sigma54-like protein